MCARLYFGYDGRLRSRPVSQDYRHGSAGCLSNIASVGLAVFRAVHVFKDVEVTFVARPTDRMRFDGLAYRTSRFMGVCAVAKPAVGRVFEYLRKIVRHFASLHLNRAEAFDAGRIDQIASVRKRNHFGECRSMNACLVIFGDIFRSELGMRQQFVDNRRFANARVPGQQRNPVADLVRQRVDSFARRSAKFHAIVPDGAIECHQFFYIFK